MKKIYSFKLSQNKEVSEVETSTNVKGEEVKVTKKVIKPINRTFFIKKPTRSLFDDAEIFYASTYSKLIQLGVISINQLNKRIIDDGGSMSKTESDEYQVLYKEAFDKQTKLNELNLIKEPDRNEEQKLEIKTLMEDVMSLFSKIQRYDNNRNSLYTNTAEVITRNRSMLWWCLQCSYEELEDSKIVPVFGDGTYQEKLKKYDDIEAREDDFEYSLIKKLLLATSLWQFGKCETQDEFDTLIKISENQNILDLGKTLEENKVDKDKEIKNENKEIDK